jgi:hypothetical protein
MEKETLNTNMEKVTKLYNDLIDEGYFTSDELALITSINGYSIETLNDCIHARYGFHDYEQLTDNE